MAGNRRIQLALADLKVEGAMRLQTNVMGKATVLICFDRITISAAPARVHATFLKSAVVKVANAQR
jgi:hypothetical protein